MSRKILLFLGALFVCVVFPSQAAPAGWFLAGKDPGSYKMDRDETVRHSGKSSGRLASVKQPQGFGTMMQSFDPVDYRGKRLKLSAFVKSNKIVNWAGLWMRVDGPEASKSLAFDNMQGRPIKGTKDWAPYAIVLDVPEKATSIAFGILLDGAGTLWIDDLNFEVVDASVATTGTSQTSKPANLNLED